MSAVETDKSVPLIRLVGSTAASCAIIGLILFMAAGTIRWTAAWVLLAEVAGGSLVLGGWLARVDRSLLAERLQPPIQRDQARWDMVLLTGLLTGFLAWAAAMGLDAVRYGMSRMPGELQAIGAMGPVACYALTYHAFRANSFASPVVKIDEGRSQQVADTGPYAVVRHPMYAAAIPFIVGTPLLLGSWIGLALSPPLILLLGMRAVGEERLLRRELPAYSSYAERVPYRMFPGVW